MSLSRFLQYIADELATTFATYGTGVTNGDSHDHSGGDGAQIDHTTLSNIGTNTHAQIDTAITNSQTEIEQVMSAGFDGGDMGEPVNFVWGSDKSIDGGAL